MSNFKKGVPVTGYCDYQGCDCTIYATYQKVQILGELHAHQRLTSVFCKHSFECGVPSQECPLIQKAKLSNMW